MSLLDGETDVEDPRSFATLSLPNQLVASPRWAQQYEVVVASGAFLQVCRVEGSMDFSCGLDGGRESVKCQITSAE